MHYFTTILSLAAYASASAIGNIPPLPIGELGWEGSVVPGGPKVEVWGSSFEDIEAKIRKDHPEFSIYNANETQTPGATENPSIAPRAVLEARQVGGYST
ncbi:hypothetical protein PspLS_08542 [Pyricularia sp. CBS 133598]|nr:hypothetical protein PspLS_08542 [Pyricularia sp. CBS 133598]